MAEVASVEMIANPFVFVEADTEKQAKQEALSIYDSDEYFGAAAMSYADEINHEETDDLYVVLVAQNAPQGPQEWHTRIQEATASAEPADTNG